MFEKIHIWEKMLGVAFLFWESMLNIRVVVIHHESQYITILQLRRKLVLNCKNHSATIAYMWLTLF
jgi:hypothetical protein